MSHAYGWRASCPAGRVPAIGVGSIALFGGMYGFWEMRHGWLRLMVKSSWLLIF